MKEPKRLEQYVVWFLAEWSAEQPTTLHRHDVYFGPPDRPNPERKARPGDLSAEFSTPDELVGGSLLGSPAYNEPARRLLEDESPHREEPSWSVGEGRISSTEKHLVTPMRSAMRRCGRFMEAYLKDVARNGGDWLTPAQKRGCLNEQIARVYAHEAFRRLYREYLPSRPAPVRRHKSDSQLDAEAAA